MEFEAPVQIRYRAFRSPEELARMSRADLTHWNPLENPKWNEDICGQLVKALPDNPWAAVPQAAFASDQQGGSALVFARYAIDDAGLIRIRGGQLQWHVSPADLARAGAEQLNPGDQDCPFSVVEEYGVGGNGHVTWEALLEIAADETLRNADWLGLLGLFHAGRRSVNKRRFARVRGMARLWVEHHGVISPTELRECVDTQCRWKVETLARRLALPVKRSEKSLKRIGYVHDPEADEWVRSDRRGAQRRRDRWMDMEGPPWLDLPESGAVPRRDPVPQRTRERKKSKSATKTSGKRR